MGFFQLLKFSIYLAVKSNYYLYNTGTNDKVWFLRA